tara:strand:+ start:4185 stop:4370 length:186 start_codon:yes stop_codon:yes gene_type:complete
MTLEQITVLTMIAFSVLFGAILGAFITVTITAKNTKELEEEVDKFRALYFNELDKYVNTKK